MLHVFCAGLVSTAGHSLKLRAGHDVGANAGTFSRGFQHAKVFAWMLLLSTSVTANAMLRCLFMWLHGFDFVGVLVFWFSWRVRVRKFVWRLDGYETFLPPQADSGNSKSIIPSEYENTISLIAINSRTIHSYDVRNQNTRWDPIFMMFAIVSPVPCDRNVFGFGSFLLVHAVQQCTSKHSSIFISVFNPN